LTSRIEREREHAKTILATNATTWGWGTPAGRIRRQRRADYLTLDVSAGKALEVGCGMGTMTGDLSNAFPDLTSIDVAEDLLAVARQRFPRVTFVNADIHHTDFASGQFDRVVGCSVLHHVELDAALREIFRILRPDGLLRFSEPNLLNPQVFLQKTWPWLKKKMGDSPDETAFTQRQLERGLRAAGFVDIHTEPYEFLHPTVPESMIPWVTSLEGWLESTPLRRIAGSVKIAARKP
jgi:ubiquinone/menaquinone biosynthesis C-methylase UbiE